MRGLILPSLAALLAATAVVAQDPSCADGLYVIVARGTDEEPGPGVTGELADDIAGRVEGSRVEALDYPATFTDPNYPDSEKEGVTAMTELITSYHSACPEGKIAVLAYSQGGQVASDVFCGGTGDGFSDAAALSNDIVDDSVVAIVLFGDPSHVANTTYDRGTSINNGIFERENITVCEAHSDILRSYCDTGDIYCDGGRNSSTHHVYVAKYGQEVVDFVVQQYEDAEADCSTDTATGTATDTGASATGTESAGAAPATASPEGAAAGLVPGLAVAAVLPIMIAAHDLLF